MNRLPHLSGKGVVHQTMTCDQAFSLKERRHDRDLVVSPSRSRTNVTNMLCALVFNLNFGRS
jgi:hypothetical protein